MPSSDRPPSLPYSRIVALATSMALVVQANSRTKAANLKLAAANLKLAAGLERAEENWNVSQTHFPERRLVLDDFGVRYAEELVKVPGAERLRQRTLENALSYYHKFIDLAGNDPTFHRDRAVTYTKIGTIKQLLGEHAKALDAYEKAGKIFRQLAESHPDADRPWADLAVCYNNIGLLQAAGRTDGAKDAFGKAIQIQERLVEERPDDAQR